MDYKAEILLLVFAVGLGLIGVGIWWGEQALPSRGGAIVELGVEASASSPPSLSGALSGSSGGQVPVSNQNGPLPSTSGVGLPSVPSRDVPPPREASGLGLLRGTSPSTPEPINVLVSSQQRSYVYYRGPATMVRADQFAPLGRDQYPRPGEDNGRGLHWFPITTQTRGVVDRFVPELVALRVRWVVILQGLNDWDIVGNDYLLQRLREAGIVPVVRIEGQVGKLDWRRLGWVVARYREQGVRYFQIYNEPNLEEEWSAPGERSPERFAEWWAQGAQVVAANGGLPGFSPMAPRGDGADLLYFRRALEHLQKQGRYDLLNLSWVGVHNYGDMDAKGFYRYREYQVIMRQVLGGVLPMIATEGGLETAEATSRMITRAYEFMAREREEYLLAYAPWLIGNFVGGGHDPRWEPSAWYTGRLNSVNPRPIVQIVKGQ